MSRIKGLQFVMLFAFCCIFLSHAVGEFAILGTAAVSVFIILSGYLMAYNCYNREIKTNAFRFLIGCLMGLYALKCGRPSTKSNIAWSALALIKYPAASFLGKGALAVCAIIVLGLAATFLLSWIYQKWIVPELKKSKEKA